MKRRRHGEHFSTNPLPNNKRQPKDRRNRSTGASVAPVANSQSVTLTPRTPGFPTRFPVQLRYRSSNTIACVSGAPGTWVFGANSLYDPDVTFTGHQPQWFDTLAAIYSNCVVYRAHFKFTVVQTGSDSAPSACVFYPANTNTASSYTLDEAREQSGAVEAFISGDKSVVTISKTIDIRELIGKFRDYVLDDTTYAGAVTASPSDVAYGIFEIGTRDGSSRTYYVEALVDFEACFSQVKQIGSS